MGYAELLKDPRWQKKRLEIMERDEWTCQMCFDTEATLTVHHISYRQVNGQFVDPWDYCNSDLVTICTDCHTTEENYLKRILPKEATLFFREVCCDSDAISTLMSVIRFIKSKRNGNRFFDPFIHDVFCQDGDIKEYYSWLREQGGNNG